MIVPTVHMNGTSKDELIRQYKSAYEALWFAFKVMCLAAPKGRDYDTQSGDALGTATKEHYDRRIAVYQVLEQYEQLIGHIEANRDGIQS